MNNKDTSWNKVSKWYSNKVLKGESYYHQNIIIPNTKRLMDLRDSSNVLDLACGEGFLSRIIPSKSRYMGVDLSKELIKTAKYNSKRKDIEFKVSDVSKNLNLQKEFTHCTIILAIQNIEDVEGVIRNAKNALLDNGKLLIVMNHPAFRIPKQSGWEIDYENKVQYRWLSTYYSRLKIPIDMTPGRESNKKFTWSFHRPISYYSKILHEYGFSISLIEEWCSDKKSQGKMAQAENIAREEFPMFMAIVAKKDTA